MPFKPKRRTKAQIAREAGLEPLADALLANRSLIPEQAARAYIDPEHQIDNPHAALEGARQIIMERISEDAALLAELRERLWKKGVIHATVVTGKERKRRNSRIITITAKRSTKFLRIAPWLYSGAATKTCLISA